ncbi:ABC transporter permease [Ensifer sp. Root31]|uniref:ABC transporter permease n=1 Tax=Ensifer sp. Root31 TaxID=1736512 RepID=UPI00070BD082|nr:ABC transporter permease [Ensifer sp. Root31]KQU86391.1 ABC transporter permease [Ensifer sp. Root31]
MFELLELRHRIVLFAVGGAIIAFLLLPTLIVVQMSFSAADFLEFPPKAYSLRWYEAYLSSPTWRNATWISFVTATSTAVVATILGTAAAYGIRLSEHKAPAVLLLILSLPLSVPVILIAVGVFYLYARIGIINSVPGLILAHVMMAIPFVTVVVFSRLKTFDLAQVHAAESLGARPIRAFFMIVAPQVRFAVASGTLLAFLTSFDEAVISLFVTNGSKSTLSKLMFTSLRDQVDPTIAAVSSLFIVLSISVAVVLQLFGARER